jgi:hypothetical protein
MITARQSHLEAARWSSSSKRSRLAVGSFPQVIDAMVLVKPATVVQWHR